MIKQPISMFRGQATDLEIQRQEIRNTKRQMVEILAKCCDKTPEVMEADISRPKYFSPYEAVEYGLIDKVLEADGAKLGKKIAKAVSQGM
jgi:ATP-dependent Clp protease protease subunit